MRSMVDQDFSTKTFSSPDQACCWCADGWLVFAYWTLTRCGTWLAMFCAAPPDSSSFKYHTTPYVLGFLVYFWVSWCFSDGLGRFEMHLHEKMDQALRFMLA